MSEKVDAAALLQGLLDEQYGKGFREGYSEALGSVLDFVKAKLTPGGGLVRVAGSFLADHPGDENDADPPGILDCQPPHVREALEYVERHPGVTAHEARETIRNKSALYTLARLGLVEKRGAQFFPKNAGA